MHRDNSVFDEINRGDDFEQDILDDANNDLSESEDSADSEAEAKARQKA